MTRVQKSVRMMMKMTKSPTPSSVRVLYTLSRGHFIHSRCLFLFQPFFLFNNFIHVFNFQMDSSRGHRLLVDEVDRVLGAAHQVEMVLVAAHQVERVLLAAHQV